MNERGTNADEYGVIDDYEPSNTYRQRDDPRQEQSDQPETIKGEDEDERVKRVTTNRTLTGIRQSTETRNEVKYSTRIQ